MVPGWIVVVEDEYWIAEYDVWISEASPIHHHHHAAIGGGGGNSGNDVAACGTVHKHFCGKTTACVHTTKKWDSKFFGLSKFEKYT